MKAVWRARGPGLIALACIAGGCGKGDFFDTGTSGPPYAAFGDSITYGETLPMVALQAYPYLFATANGLALKNYGADSEMGCDVAAHQIFAHGVSPSTSVKATYSVLIGTTDVDVSGAGAHESIFSLCHLAAIAWLAVPVENKLTSPASNGATHLETSNHWNARFTDAAGSSLTYSVSLPAAGPIYIWCRITDGSTGTFVYALDGGAPVSVASAPAAAIQTISGTTSTLGLLRIPSIAAGAHRLVLTQTSAGASGMGIVAVGYPSTSPTSPRVLAGLLPKQLAGGYLPCANVTPPCDAYNADIAANVALLAGDGLNIQTWDSRKYMTGTAADLSDAAHPNVVGQVEIAHALQDVY